VAVVGDVMGHLGTAIAETEGQPFGMQIGRGLWQFAAEHDEVWGNLEGPARPEADGAALHLQAWNCSPSPWPRLFFSARQLPVLAAFGFRVLGVANNHTFDFGGADDAERSAQLLRGHGIAAAGVDLTPVIREIGGVSIAVFSLTGLLNAARPLGPVALFTRRTADQVVAAVAAARREVDHVVALVHWGTEYSYGPSASQRAAAAVLTDAGVSVVVGSHSHVLWPVTVAGGGEVVCWSLGNFLAVFACPSGDPSYGRFRRALWSGVLSLEFDARRVRAVLQPIAVEHTFDAWHEELGAPASYLGWGPVELATWQAGLAFRRFPLRSIVDVHGPLCPVPLDDAAAASLDPWRGDGRAHSWTVPLLKAATG
jgi:Bacterial capsule synthesis protein PGA_cap